MEVATPARRPPARWVLSFGCLIQQAVICPRFVPSCACAVDYLTHMLPQYVRAAVGDALRSLPIPATAPVEVDAAPTAGADARPVLQAQVAYLRHILTALRDDARRMFMEWVPELLKRVVLGVVSPLKSALSAAKSEVSLLETANKRLSNDNLQLLERAHKSQGNIVVYVRIRPKTPFEAALDTGNNAARSGDAVSAMNTRASPTDMDELGSSPISLLSATELAFYDARGRSWRPAAVSSASGVQQTHSTLRGVYVAACTGTSFSGCLAGWFHIVVVRSLLVYATQLVQQLSSQLEEKKLKSLYNVVDAIGLDGARQLLADTLQLEANGGLTIADGSRRRTPGGVFFYLLKACVWCCASAVPHVHASTC